MSIGLAQPFGDYLAQQDRAHSPLAFADTLLRTGVKLAGLGLEFLMGSIRAAAIAGRRWKRLACSICTHTWACRCW